MEQTDYLFLCLHSGTQARSPKATVLKKVNDKTQLSTKDVATVYTCKTANTGDKIKFYLACTVDAPTPTVVNT